MKQPLKGALKDEGFKKNFKGIPLSHERELQGNTLKSSKGLEGVSVSLDGVLEKNYP